MNLIRSNISSATVSPHRMRFRSKGTDLEIGIDQWQVESEDEPTVANI